MKNTRKFGTMIAGFLCIIVAGPAWAAIGFSSGQSLDAKDFLSEARENAPPEAPRVILVNNAQETYKYENFMPSDAPSERRVFLDQREAEQDLNRVRAAIASRGYTILSARTNQKGLRCEFLCLGALGNADTWGYTIEYIGANKISNYENYLNEKGSWFADKDAARTQSAITAAALKSAGHTIVNLTIRQRGPRVDFGGSMLQWGYSIDYIQ